MRLAVYVIPVAMAIYALFDLYRSEPAERAGLKPALWALIIVLLPVLGPIAWIFVSVLRRAEVRNAGRAAGRSGGPVSGFGGRRPMRPARRPGPVAPDDDPDFLRDLEQQWMRERGNAASDPDAPPQGD